MVFSASAPAQSNPRPYEPLSQVRDFLQLSDSQVIFILANNSAHSLWSFEKHSRIQQVRTEIAQETAKEALDSIALGVRYAEVELICRDIKSQATAYQAKNTELLTDPQKAKLKVLQDAMKLTPIIAEAQLGNLINGFPISYFTSLGVVTGSALLTPPNGCSPLFPTVRQGHFSSVPLSGDVVPGDRAIQPK